MATPTQPSVPTADSIRTIADLGRDASGAELITVTPDDLGAGLPASVPMLFDRRNGRLLSVKEYLEAYRLRPERRTGTATATTLASFIHLTNRHKDAGSVIFAATEWPDPSLTAVIDYHGHAGDDAPPRHCQHRVRYEFPITDEMRAWIDNNTKPMSQADFCAWIEEHAADLSSPTDDERNVLEPMFDTRLAVPSQMMELSRGLSIHVAGQVKQAITLRSGEGEVVFVEEHRDANGEKIIIPGLFIVRVAAFRDGEPVRIPARLRYRVGGGKIVWLYQLYRWEEVLRVRVLRDLTAAADATELPAFEGTPEVDG